MEDENTLSPIEQIRQTEAEVTRRIAAAREVAEKTLVEARAQAAMRKEEARQAGRLEGDKISQQVVSQAEEMARLTLEQAHQQAEMLRRKGEHRMTQAIAWAVKFVIGLEEEGYPADER